MPSYNDLVAEISRELNRPDLNNSIPDMIRRAEQLVWADVTGSWLEQQISLLTTADVSEYSVPELSLLIRPIYCIYDEDTFLTLAPSRLRDPISKQNEVSNVPEYCIYSVGEQKLWLYPAPNEDGKEVLFVGDFRDAPLQAGDDETTNRLLLHCYELLVLRALMCVVDSRIQLWEKQYVELLSSKRRQWIRERKTGFTRKAVRRWF